MWIFVFVLAMVPLLFHWSDQVVTVFPALAEYLPKKTGAGDDTAHRPGGLDGKPVPGKDGQWVQAHTEQGYAAWLISADDQYRLAVGCRKGLPASMQVTGAYQNTPPPPPRLVLDYRYGQAPFVKGTYAGRSLIGELAQFETVVLQVPAQPGQQPAPFAQFRALTVESGKIARRVQQACAVN